ncbi:helix-turn-helix domain-containing protein [Micromonospora sp. NBC_01813]|uniref:helix-turn-helix domain-containing protein n=1 Tax=Micromonospora sp. NBC_01813 TaxID=2975988 RepID=UPI002DD9C76A|nr:helix-turn-helix transcriptional regulator [Micromonospora sp. NBC_01813]WSA11758.1 helix-turn-helix transcriptional regulator [Micromonospora sp. NBC_01813]
MVNELGDLLRRERISRGMTQDAVGTAVHISGSAIGHFEKGKSAPQETTADALDLLFGTGSRVQELAREARGEAVAPWLRPWVENEKRSLLLRTVEPTLIPGLLQTEAYARAILSAGQHTPEQVEELVAIRMARQTAALERAEPAALVALIGEPALHTGDPVFMKDQLEHLVDIGDRYNVHIRVIPQRAGLHAGLAGAFVIATLIGGAQIGYLDDQLEGRIAATSKDMATLVRTWEALSGIALTCEQSRNLILKVIDEHEERATVAQVQS